jgi:hypothetical protein
VVAEAQYRQVLANGRRQRVAAIGSHPAMARVLRKAARDSRRLERARHAWDLAVDATFAENTQVDVVEADCLVVAVRDAVLRHRLKAAGGRLLRAVRVTMPEVRQLRFRIRDEVEPAD